MPDEAEPLARTPRLVWASYRYRVEPWPPTPVHERSLFLVLCASCMFVPDASADTGTVACELVYSRQFATSEEAGAHLDAIDASTVVWGHERRNPQDVVCLAEVAADESEPENVVLQYLCEDPDLRDLLKHVHETWIGAKNPYEVTLAEARAYPGPNALAVLEGDDGGQTYVVSPVKFIRCDEATLKRLLADLDAIEWPGQPEMAHLSFHRPISEWWDPDRIWVHERLQQKGLEPRIKAVLAGERSALGAP